MPRGIPISLLALVLITCGICHGQAENQVRQQLQGSVFGLRSAVDKERLDFDDTGKLLTTGTPLPLTNGGQFYVESVDFKLGEIVLKGARVVYQYKTATHRTSHPQEVRIRMRSQPASTTESLWTSLKQVLFYGAELVDRLASSYRAAATTDAARREASAKGESIAYLAESRPVYGAGPGVSLPQLTRDVFPEWPGGSRLPTHPVIVHVVINEHGIPELFQVTQSLGQRFDENAISAVADWRFRPAKRNGIPVAVALDVELNFHP